MNIISNKRRYSKREYHGLRNTRLYEIWHKMKDRCLNSKIKCYPNYGGRGIKICQEWLSSFVNFSNWANVNGYSDDLTIDRIDSDGDYCPNNCRFVTLSQQTENRGRRIKCSKYGIGIRFINNKYYVRINKNRKEIRIGSYSNLDEARKARKEAELKYFLLKFQNE